jgi:prophage antirepressor-like protein
LILSSTKPEAKAFKRWITHEVLPELRKAGKYSTEAVAAKDAKIQELIKKIESKEKDITNSESTTKNLKKELNILQVELRMTLKKDPSQTEVYPPEVWNNLKHPLIEEN